VSRDRYLKQFGQQLRQARTRRGLSQENLAKAAQLHPVAVSLIERGHRAVRLDTLRRLCLALRVQPGDLVPPVQFPK
jgi:transcriptional regulator with XRE-family HTH domain